MASPDKQQKRAQRAKVKAKQNRAQKPGKKVVHPIFASPLVDQPFDDIELDLSEFDFQDIVENGFDPADFQELFDAMFGAEKISQMAMCAVFLQYPVLAMVISEEDEEQATDFMMGLLVTYRSIVYGEDEDTAIEWIGSSAFQTDYNEASRLLVLRDQKAS